MEKIELFRQGDIAFVKVDELPKGLKEINAKERFVLRRGEVTGHAHVLVKENPKTKFKVLQDKEGNYYLQIEGAPAKVVHEEHEDLILQPGAYLFVVQREFDELEYIREVKD